MHIANLQAVRRSRGVAAFQWLRVVIVLALAGGGAFAVSLSTDDRDASSGITAADVQAASSPRISDTSTVTAEASAQASSTQVASADAGVSDLTVDHAMDMGSSAEATPQALAPEKPAMASSDAPPHEAKQASAHEPPPPAAPEMTGAVNVASIASNPPADDLIDLNTASFEQLNTLKGTGPLGRAIIKGRPYASVEDLVKRKIIRRTAYEKIKDQVTVR